MIDFNTTFLSQRALIFQKMHLKHVSCPASFRGAFVAVLNLRKSLEKSACVERCGKIPANTFSAIEFALCVLCLDHVLNSSRIQR